MSRFWKRSYGLKFALGIEDAFSPQISSGTGMYDLEPDGRGNFLRIEMPTLQAIRTAAERRSER